jgi:hypothetical protein
MLLVVVNGPLAVTTRTGRPCVPSTWNSSKRALSVVGVGVGTGCNQSQYGPNQILFSYMTITIPQPRTSKKRLTTIGFRASSYTPSSATI